MVKDIKFIKTDKTSEDLEKIQKDYPNSIINVNSNRERNVYVGDYRITDNYNLGVDENSITNDVGGISSGINASEFKGKSISEILDTILFAKNNNLTLKGVVVVDKIDNLTDDTLKDVYQGMVVSVIEDNSLYILLSDSDIDSGEREWERVGSYSKLSAPIKVAGIGKLGNIKDGDEYKIGHSIEDILRDLLSREEYPTVSLYTKPATIEFLGIKGGSDGIISNKSDLIKIDDNVFLTKIGSVLNLNSVTLNEATISNCYRVGQGFNWGYSKDNDNSKDGDGNPDPIDGTSNLTGDYILEEKYEGLKEGEERKKVSSETLEDVKFDTNSVKIGLGENKITITATSRSGEYSHPVYPEYYGVSNVGKTSEPTEEYKKCKLNKSDAINGTVAAVVVPSKIKVIGVYPVYVNIDFNAGKLISDATTELKLTNGKRFEIDVPTEVGTGLNFMFDYPATHTVDTFKLYYNQEFVDYKSTYNKVFEEITKVVEGNEIKYKRLKTTGGSNQGPNKYEITLTFGLDTNKIK
jgi:hypothetical protein